MNHEPPYLFRHRWIDSSRAPLYVLSLPAVVAATDLQAPAAEYETFLKERPHPVAWVTLVRNVVEFDAEARAVLAAFERRIADLEHRWNMGQAFVLDSAFQRMLLSAVQWMALPVYPHRTFSKEDEGIRWASERLSVAKPRPSSRVAAWSR